MKMRMMFVLLYLVTHINTHAQAPKVIYGHNADFSRVSGTLLYSGIEGPSWQIIYAPKPDVKDIFQGKLLLFNKSGGLFSPPKPMKSGDYVIIHGFLRQQPEVSFYGSTQQYTVTEIKQGK